MFQSPALLQLRERLGRRLSRPSFLTYATVALMLLGWLLGQRLSENAGLSHLEALASERLELYASNLEAELGRHGYLPSLLAVDESLQALLQNPRDPLAQQRARQTLARVNVRAGTMQILVANPQGQVLAASDDSPAPQRLGEAIAAERRHFFASEPGGRSSDFFLLQAVRQQQKLLGVIVVRLSLAPLEATWVELGLRSQGERLLVADEQDVIIMSSVPYWKFFVLGQADEARRQALRQSAHYPDSPFTSVGVGPRLLADSHASLIRVPPLEDKTRLIEGPRLLAQERLLVPLGLRMVALSDPAEVWRQARHAGWSGAAFGASLGLLALYLASRRRALQQLFQAKAELQQAHAQLERVVDMRTAELLNANAELKRQIAQRLQAEDELVQAGKLAVLGQMSAGISHEVNQPLTALRALARNSQLLLEAGKPQAVAQNLRIMDEMVERMGQITRQLKSFARRNELITAPVSLLDSVHAALLLFQHRLRDEHIDLQLRVASGLRVYCEANRLQQVLVNLIGNALDAMKAEPVRVLCIDALPQGQERVLVRVVDSGQGLDEALLPRLFEPFFTTKPAGEGLGLGLVISSKIVHEFGGTLRAERQTQGMVFAFDLAVVTWDAVEEVAQHV